MRGVGLWSVGVWALGVGGVVAVVAAAVGPLGEGGLRSSVVGSRLTVEPPPTAYPAESLASVVVARDPFRATRRSAEVAYDAARLEPIAAQPTPPKPALVLSGIVWSSGREAAAVIAGLPGVDGPRVLRVGEQAVGITVRAISTTEVRLVGLDTTWVLHVRQP